jgi:hypothetical protein
MPPRSASWRARQTVPPPPPSSLSSLSSLSSKAATASTTPKLSYKESLEKAAAPKPVIPRMRADPRIPVMGVYDRVSCIDYGGDDYYEEEDHSHLTEMEEGNEFNAELYNNRRRGDNGVW